MDPTPLLIIGSGGHAKVVIDIVDAIGGYEVVGIVSDDDNPSRLVAGHRILSDLSGLPSFLDQGIRHVAMGIGGWTDNEDRRRAYLEACSLGFEAVSAVHPNAFVAPSVHVGSGAVVYPGVVLHTEASLGANSIVVTNASVDHETTIGDHVLISAGVTVGAQVDIGDGALLGMGSTVTSRVTIGAGALVAAGAVVINDVAEGGRVFGLPAKPAGA